MVCMCCACLSVEHLLDLHRLGSWSIGIVRSSIRTVATARHGGTKRHIRLHMGGSGGVFEDVSSCSLMLAVTAVADACLWWHVLLSQCGLRGSGFEHLVFGGPRCHMRLQRSAQRTAGQHGHVMHGGLEPAFAATRPSTHKICLGRGPNVPLQMICK
jgi:hypothetical protein